MERNGTDEHCACDKRKFSARGPAGEKAGFSGFLGTVVRTVPDARADAQQFGIMSIPTLVFFKEGRVTDTLVGLRDKAAILSLLK